MNKRSVNVVIFLCWTLGIVGLWASSVARAESKPAIKYALLFGVQKFECADSLEGPGNDLSLVRKEWLDKNGFQAKNIVALCDAPNVPSNAVPTKQNFFDKLTEIGAKTRPQDTLCIVVGTHGVSYKGFSFLLPKDAKTASFDELRDEDDPEKINDFCEKNNLISVASLCDRLRNIKGNIVVVLDACRVNKGFSKNDVGGFQKELTSFSQKENYGTLVFLTSCGLTELANEPEIVNGKRYGLFLYYLVEGLQGDADLIYGNYDGKVSPFEAYNYAAAKTRRTAADTNKRQSPQISFSGNSSKIKDVVLANCDTKNRSLPFNDRSDAELVLDLGSEILQSVKDATSFRTETGIKSTIESTIKGFDYVLKEDSNSREARGLRAFACRMLGDYAKALDDFKIIGEDMVLFAQKTTYAYKEPNENDSFLIRDAERHPRGFEKSDFLIVDEVKGEWLRISQYNGIRVGDAPHWVKKSDVLWTKEQANANYQGGGTPSRRAPEPRPNSVQPISVIN